MPLYKYRAMNEKGRKLVGTLNSVNPMDLESNLRTMGLDLIRFGEVRQSRLGNLLQKKVTTDDLIQTCIHLEQLDRAGVPLLESLNDVREATDSPRLQNVLTEVVRSVSEGMYLSKALDMHPKIFSPVFSGVISAGEQSGNLTDAFAHLSHHLKWQSELTQKIKKATRYPMFMLIMVLGVVFMMMIFVVPQVAEFLISTQGELPLVTKALIGTSDFFGNYWWILIITPISLFLAARAAVKMSESAAYQWDSVKLQVPGIGPVLKKIALSRFSHFFSLTFKSGIDILSCIDTGQRVVANRVLAEALRNARQSVQGGSTLSAALESTGQFPHLVVRMFKVGEDSGKLNDALENIGYFYDREVDNSVQSMIGMMEPTLTVMIGSIVLWVVVGIMGPIYDSFGNLG